MPRIDFETMQERDLNAVIVTASVPSVIGRIDLLLWDADSLLLFGPPPSACVIAYCVAFDDNTI